MKPMPRAAVVVARDRAGRTVVGTRRPELNFLGGYVVFPGGRVEADDEALAAALGLDPGEPLSALRAAGLRELLEEVRLFPVGDRLVHVPDALAGAGVLEVAHALAHRPDLARLAPIARWVTPHFSDVRFDATYLLLEVDAIEAPIADPSELTSARLVAPGDELAAWRAFSTVVAPPTMHTLEALAAMGGDPAGPALVDAVRRRLDAAPGAGGVDVTYSEVVPGIRQIPLETPTLPPARHTNTYVVGGRAALVVDPATYDDGERARLLEELARARAFGAEPAAILLTHHHGDHVGSAAWLRDTLGLPILAHVETAALLEGVVTVDRLVADGDVLDLGDPSRPFPVEVWHTPGHAWGHVVLLDRRPGARAMIVGDMVASIGTIIVDPSEGNMAEYLRQLRRLAAVPGTILFPAHGFPILDGPAKFEQYIAHRLLREARVREALAVTGGGTVEALLPHAYADTPVALYGLAARSCLAHLEKLVEDGLARRMGERFERLAG
jgi:glyoxylase-like metal-dependent hydrolase (beta-lactamase superfamily II)/8-oxo-dGTP pyrophosphatase MutT (NUDIX family)